ncbi:MAG: antibiotic biosynthesis monooxygenase [Sphingomonadaceae bacterium]|nr:antibiotic biosynthesis monooxygenase [Sphingomonadaceae bacterium]
MILVTGEILAKPDRAAEVEGLSLAHVKRSRAEDGCISHDVHRHVEDANRFVFVETWSDMIKLKAHFALPEAQQFARQVALMAQQPVKIEIFHAVPIAANLSL